MQKGVAQLLQIEEVQLKFPEGVVSVNHHIHKKLIFFSFLHSLRHIVRLY